jgi:hypothetical protein
VGFLIGLSFLEASMKISSETRNFFRKIGRRGAYARALALSPEQRRAQAVKAIRTRWDRVRALRAQQAAEQTAEQPENKKEITQ